MIRGRVENTHLAGGVPEWPKGTDCKSVGSAFGGSNPPPSTISPMGGIAPIGEMASGGPGYRARREAPVRQICREQIWTRFSAAPPNGQRPFGGAKYMDVFRNPPPVEQGFSGFGKVIYRPARNRIAGAG